MAATAPLPDALPTNWVDRYAPAGLRPWLKIGRFDRPAGIWLLMLPGWQGVALADAMEHRLPNLGLLFQVFVGAALMRAAGCVFFVFVVCVFVALVVCLVWCLFF